jgi:hypothetical protein
VSVGKKIYSVTSSKQSSTTYFPRIESVFSAVKLLESQRAKKYSDEIHSIFIAPYTAIESHCC